MLANKLKILDWSFIFLIFLLINKAVKLIKKVVIPTNKELLKSKFEFRLLNVENPTIKASILTHIESKIIIDKLIFMLVSLLENPSLNIIIPTIRIIIPLNIEGKEKIYSLNKYPNKPPKKTNKNWKNPKRLEIIIVWAFLMIQLSPRERATPKASHDRARDINTKSINGKKITSIYFL